MTRLGCFSDVQMGAPLGWYPGDRLAYQESVLDQALAIFRDEGCDAILLGGDGFHDRRPDPDVIVAFERPLVAHRDLGGPPVVGIVGNHDVRNQAGASALEAFALAGLMTVDRQPGLHYVRDVAVLTMPWTPTHELVAKAAGGDRDDLNYVASEYLHTIARDMARPRERAAASVLLTHFAIDGCILPTGLPALGSFWREPCLDANELAAMGYAAVVAGHVERAQLLIDDPPVFFCGSPNVMDWGQASYEHGVWIVDIEAGLAVPRFVPIEPPYPFVAIDWDFFDGDDFSQLHEHHGDWSRVENAIVRVRYRCGEEHQRHIDERRVEADLVQLGAGAVFIEPDIQRASRARVEVDDTVTDQEALQLYLQSQGCDEEQQAALLARAQSYFEAVPS